MYRRMGTYLTLISLILLPWTAPADLCADIARFRDSIQAFAAMGDRTTGTPGNDAAVAYIEQQFAALGAETAGAQIFPVTTRRYGPARLVLSQNPDELPLYHFNGNVITPNIAVPADLGGPLVYAGNGELRELNGKPVEGAIVLMEMTSGRNWLNAASLGAKALIYIDRGETSKALFREKVELSPIAFPRFWLPLETARKHLGAFESAPDGIPDPAVG